MPVIKGGGSCQEEDVQARAAWKFRVAVGEMRRARRLAWGLSCVLQVCDREESDVPFAEVARGGEVMALPDKRQVSEEC